MLQLALCWDLKVWWSVYLPQKVSNNVDDFYVMNITIKYIKSHNFHIIIDFFFFWFRSLGKSFTLMWAELAALFENFLFSQQWVPVDVFYFPLYFVFHIPLYFVFYIPLYFVFYFPLCFGVHVCIMLMVAVIVSDGGEGSGLLSTFALTLAL